MAREELKNKDKEKFAGVYFSVLIVGLIFASLIFSTVALSFGESVKTQPLYLFLSYSLSGVTIIIVTLAYSLYNKGRISLGDIGIKSCSAKYYLYAILLFIAVFFGLGGVNVWFTDFLTDCYGYKPVVTTLPEFSVTNYLLVILTLCILPAFTEEIAFRGVVQSGISSGSVIVDSLIGGVIFSLFHMNPAQTPYQFAMGFVLSLIVLKSGSVFPSVTAHFINNLTVVTSEYFFPDFLSDKMVFAIVTAVGLICLGVLLVLLLRKKDKKTDKGDIKKFLLYCSVGLFICVIMWVSNLFV